jgi:hypothetical protein
MKKTVKEIKQLEYLAVYTNGYDRTWEGYTDGIVRCLSGSGGNKGEHLLVYAQYDDTGRYKKCYPTVIFMHKIAELLVNPKSVKP